MCCRGIQRTVFSNTPFCSAATNYITAIIKSNLGDRVFPLKGLLSTSQFIQMVCKGKLWLNDIKGTNNTVITLAAIWCWLSNE